MLRDPAVQNALCQPNVLHDTPLNWMRGTIIGMGADRSWSREPDIADWLERSRLNMARGLKARGDDAKV